MPITNRFDVLQVEVISYVTTGLFQGQHKESILKEFCVPLPTLTKREPLTLRFPLSIKDDLLKRTKTAAGERL